MKSIRMTAAGLCLGAMLVMSMVVAGTASAAPHWLVCLERHEGTLTTKWFSHQCKTAIAEGNWEWSELKGTEEARSHASLRLSDTKILGKTVSVSCTGEDIGSIGPGRFDTITEIKNIACVKGANCEEITKTPEPVNLPWQTELVEEEGKLRDKITNGKTGKEAPGWAVTCKVLTISETDRCTSTEGSTSAENSETSGPNGLELLVLTAFDNKTAAAECSIGGKGAGEVRGPDAVLLHNGWAVAVTK